MANKALEIAAQSIMDAYFQDYAAADAFFRIEDFADWLGKAYGKYADEVAKEIYKSSLAEMGTGMLIFSQDWWATKEASVEVEDGEYFVKTDFKFMGFTYDSQNSGIQEIMPVGKSGNCGTYMRTTLSELWITGNTSRNNIVWWYTTPDKIRFKNNSNCNPKKVAIYYIPTAEDDNFKVPQSKAFEIATLAFNFMIAAKKETQFVDTTNNSNKNVTPQTETAIETAKPVGA